MGARGPAENERKEVVLRLLRRGDVRLVDAASIAAVTPTRVRQWCREIGLDYHAARRRRVAEIVGQIERAARAGSAGRRPRKPTKAELRAWLDRKVRAYLARQRRK